ncbi:MAG TPA: hypothetical protein DD381_03950 [Lentisphaeria bacterium]|nr:MAG: hypothetical protein A2X47_06680 [Lentisphaerae bacterium GWF2_38_69]HBM15483.1 hypothetical protein [Lentisphaeria bacterium]
MENRRLFISDISASSRRVLLKGRIDRVVQTGGPTIFFLSDGTGNLALKGFIKPGERAFPEILEGMSVQASIEIGEFKGELEGEIKSIKELNEREVDELRASMREIEIKRAKVKDIEFLVKNEILDKLKPRIIKAAEEIRLAIIQNRPIIIRHHNDCDGYSSGFALERAIVPLIIKQHNSEKAPWEFFQRAPCQAPFYELEDSIRDTANSLRNVAKFSNKMPLIIICDNGSCEEDLMAIKQGRIHGSDFIVVDHHGFDQDVISEQVLAHINPFLVGESGSLISAGMLCVELARFINENVENILQIAAMSGYSDRIDIANKETMEKYLALAIAEGYSKELLSDIGLVIEFVSSKVRFMEVREYVEVVFGQPRNKQKELVSLLAPYIKELDKKGLAIGKAGAIQEKLGSVTLQTIEIEKSFPGFGFFPKPGRAVSLIHENYLQETGTKALITAGIMNTAITLRATNEANFSLHELKKYIYQKVPNAFIEGGGHKNAGSITFLPCKKDEVVDCLHEFILGRTNK